MEQLLFNDVSFNNVTVLLNDESIVKLVADMIRNDVIPVTIISDAGNQTLIDIAKGAPPEFTETVTAVVFSIEFKQNFKA